MKNISEATAYLKGTPVSSGGTVVELPLEDEPVIRPFLDELHICYLVDNGQDYEYIQNRDLTQNEMSPNDLEKVGLRNLEHLIAKRNLQVKYYGNIFAVQMGGDFEASLILLEKFWDVEFRKFVKNNYAVAAPTRDVLAFCDADSSEGIIELRQVINRVWPSNDHLISNKLYIRTQAQWNILNRTSQP